MRNTRHVLRRTIVIPMITHTMDHPLELGDRLVVMGAGRTLADVSGPEMATLQTTDVVDMIISSGGVVSERSLLAGAEAVAR
jgi:ABC-type uncharacterized transport system ATPase component